MTRTPIVFAVLLLTASPVAATDCPEGLPSCRVLILSPQEEQILTAPNGVLATAAEARKVDFAGVAEYFARRIKDAPAGEVKKPAAPPEPDKNAPPKQP